VGSRSARSSEKQGDPSTGLPFGNGGVILRTTNGGVTFLYRNKSEGIPKKVLLSQNYPNPFNPSTTIKFELPKSAMVKLSVYDVLGREVSVLVKEQKAPGSYEVIFDGAGFTGGVYLYRLQAGNFVQTRRFLLLK
jgi:hypothetical protein